MTRKTFFAVAIPLAITLTAACGGGGADGAGGGGASSSSASTSSASTASTSSSSSGAGGGQAVAPDIAGKWSSGCLTVPMGGGGTQYITLDFDITANHWALDYAVHGDDKCSTGFITVHIEGPYELIAPSSTVTGAWDAKFSFDKKTVTPASDAAVMFLSSLGPCGNGQFTKDMPTDVLTAGCAGLGDYPAASCPADYDIVKLAGGKLSFGQRPADNNMCTPDKRPTMISPVALTKQ